MTIDCRRLGIFPAALPLPISLFSDKDCALSLSVLRRNKLLERLELELQLQHGFRLLILCILMFGIVIYASLIESQAQTRLGILCMHVPTHTHTSTCYSEYI